MLYCTNTTLGVKLQGYVNCELCNTYLVEFHIVLHILQFWITATLLYDMCLMQYKYS